MKEKNCIIVFIKYPQPGLVKTRLAKDIGSRHAAGLYAGFIREILTTLQRIKEDVLIFYNPTHSLKAYKTAFGKKYVYMAQKGNNLGTRMNNAFITCFNKGYTKTIIIGSDMPDISAQIIKKAFISLSSHDAVIGPAYDGGYYLIGFKQSRFESRIFKNIQWSTDKVYKKTIKICAKNKIKTKILQKMRDIDTIKDLSSVYKKMKKLTPQAVKTIKYLHQNKKLLSCLK